MYAGRLNWVRDRRPRQMIQVRMPCQPGMALALVPGCCKIFRSHLLNTRRRRVCFGVMAVCLVLWCWLTSAGDTRVGRYVSWNHQSLPRLISNTKYFKHGRDDAIFMYSAIANYHLPVNGAINIIITALDASSLPLQCCVLLDNDTLYLTPSQPYFFYYFTRVTFVGEIVDFFNPKILKAHQFSCVVPETGRHAGHVTLTSSACSTDFRDYLPVMYPERIPGGLAVCAKIAHSAGLDPERVIEWFELQRLLGVDKVLIYNLGVPERVNRVFRFYQEIGVLDLQPYELPGDPPNRTLMEKEKRLMQFSHDESLAVIECRQRMAGYSYVISHDLDEYIIPRRDLDLKEFFKEKMEEFQDSAGFYFDTEFFIYNWGPTNPEEDLALTRYRKATKPHDECTKFVFLPYRTLSITTHHMSPLPPYTTYKLGQHEAILHHYRRCPDDVWSTCFPETIVDHVMTRYHELHSRVLKVRQATRTRPAWSLANQRT